MDLSRPHSAVCPTLDTAVLTVLAGTTRRLTGREVARLAGRRSHRGVTLALDRLVEHGLVDREEAGSALLYTLNRDHLAAPAVEILADMPAELIRRLRHAIDEWKIAPVHASLFGSAARGDGDTESDIDLFLTRPTAVSEEDPRWRDQVHRLAADIRRWTGNHGAIVQVAEDEIERLVREQPPLLEDLHTDAVLIAGAGLSTLLGAGI